jgi:co-chaperonin GroES (HSP10)
MRPILDRIVVKRLPRAYRGLVALLPEDIPKDVYEAASAPETVVHGLVMRTGPGRRRRGGGRLAMPVRQGDEVLFYSHVGVPIGDGLLVMKPEDILGMVC